MIDKSLIIVIFMYCISISILGGQYMIADLFGLTLTNYRGEPIPTAILENTQTTRLDEITKDITEPKFNGTINGKDFDKVADFNVGMAYAVWEFVSLLTGSYIFYIIYHLGIPIHIVSALVLIYGFFLTRTIVGILRGV